MLDLQAGITGLFLSVLDHKIAVVYNKNIILFSMRLV